MTSPFATALAAPSLLLVPATAALVEAELDRLDTFGALLDAHVPASKLAARRVRPRRAALLPPAAERCGRVQRRLVWLVCDHPRASSHGRGKRRLLRAADAGWRRGAWVFRVPGVAWPRLRY